jgi:uncharacterized HAD superfamily protein
MIAFDIDGCLNYIKEDIVKIGKEFFKTSDVEFNREGYYLREIYSGAPQEMYNKFWELHGYEIYTNPPQKDAQEVILYIKQQGIPVCCITTRNVLKKFNGISFDKITTQWLKKYDMELPVYYRKDKDVVAKDLCVSLIVEDKPSNILKLQKVTQVLIFDHPYNENMDGKHVKRWEDVKDYITDKRFKLYF